MKSLLRFFFLWLPLCLSAQKPIVEISNPVKLSNKANKFRVIGRNSDGIAVRLYGALDMINVYNEQMQLAAAKTIDFKNEDGMLQYVMLNKSGAVIFYLSQDKKYSVLLAQPVNSKYIEVGKPLVIDTIYDKKDLVASNLRFKSAVDQSHVMIYYPFFTGNKITSIQFICIDHTLQLVYNKTIPVNRDESELEESKTLIDNDGNAFIIVKPQKVAVGDIFDVLRIAVSGDFTTYRISTLKPLFGEPSFEIDNKNGNLVMCGFYNNTTTGEDVANGFLYTSYNPASGATVKTSYTLFSKEFMTALTGRAATETGKLYTFIIRKVILRNDGGAIIIAESLIKDTREVPINIGMQPGFTNYHTSIMYQFNDIIAFSMNATGEVEWNSVLHKKQASEDDNGAYSSFLIANEKDKLHFLFLDDISTSGELNQYVLTSDGKSKREPVLNMEEKDVMLLPKLGKQVSPNQVVIPSYKNGALRLTKITF